MDKYSELLTGLEDDVLERALNYLEEKELQYED